MPRFHFDGRPELRTSYANQRQLAIREIGAAATCVHAVPLADGCPVCRASGTPLVLAACCDDHNGCDGGYACRCGCHR